MLPDKTLKIDINFSELKRVNITFKFIRDESGNILYPQQSKCHMEMKSTVLPPKLLGLLNKKAENMIEEAYKQKKEHVFAVYEFLHNVIEGNNLIPCWAEFAEIK